MSKEKKRKHLILRTVIGTAAAGTAAYGSYAYLLFRNGFDTDKSRYHPDGLCPNSEETAMANEWFMAAKRRDEYLRSYDGLSLHAIRIENHADSDKWIVIMHGYHRCCWDMLHLMMEADRRGYNILACDERASGNSEGHYTGLGWPEHYDLLSWVNHLNVLRPKSRIVIYGIDLGANAVMNAVGDFLPANVVCAIEEGGWADIRRQFEYAAGREASLPVKPFMPAVDLLVRANLSFSMNEVSTIRQLSRCNIPMLFLHGADDEIVPVSNAEECAAAVRSEKEVVIFKATGFGGCRYNENYYDVLFGFADKHVLGS